MSALTEISHALLNTFKTQGLVVRDWITAGSFAQQREFIEDPSRFKALLTPRRGGKSEGAAACAVETAYLFPGSNILITGMALESTRKSFENTIDLLLEKIPLNALIGVHKRQSPLQWEFANGSKIWITGAASGGKSRINRFKGTKYRLVIADEPQAWPDNILYDFVNEVILPALSDQKGKLILCGTPGIGETYWYKINYGCATDGLDWKTFTWSVLDNPYVADEVSDRMRTALSLSPGLALDPTFQREYEGKWVVDIANQIFQINDWNKILHEPEWDRLQPWQYTSLLGIDFGYDPDPCAFVVVRYKYDDPKLYVLYAENFPQMLPDDQVARAAALMKQYKCNAWVADSGALGKTLTENIKYKLGNYENIPVEKHAKRKWRYQMDLNSELLKANILFKNDTYARFENEWKTLCWNSDLKKIGKFEEVSNVPNHISDALRYVHTAAEHFKARKVVTTPPTADPFLHAVINREKQRYEGASELDLLKALG